MITVVRSKVFSYTGCLLFALSSGLLFSIGLVIRVIRYRQQPVVDTENNLSDVLPKSMEPTGLKKHDSSLAQFTVLDSSMQAIGSDHPLADNQFITSTHYTSGFLAARADIERSENISWHSEVPAMDFCSKPDPKITLKCQCSSEQGSCTCNLTTMSADIPSSQRPAGTFREVAHLDTTEQFPDERDPQIFWRRRTMVFGTKP